MKEIFEQTTEQVTKEMAEEITAKITGQVTEEIADEVTEEIADNSYFDKLDKELDDENNILYSKFFASRTKNRASKTLILQNVVCNNPFYCELIVEFVKNNPAIVYIGPKGWCGSTTVSKCSIAYIFSAKPLDYAFLIIDNEPEMIATLDTAIYNDLLDNGRKIIDTLTTFTKQYAADNPDNNTNVLTNLTDTLSYNISRAKIAFTTFFAVFAEDRILEKELIKECFPQGYACYENIIANIRRIYIEEKKKG